MYKTLILQLWAFKNYRLEMKKKVNINVLNYIRGPVLSLIDLMVSDNLNHLNIIYFRKIACSSLKLCLYETYSFFSLFQEWNVQSQFSENKAFICPSVVSPIWTF